MKDSLNKTIGNNIRNLRNHTSMTQEQLANYLGVSVPTISLYESGTRTVPLESLVVLSRIFNISIDNLLTVSTFDMPKDNEVYFEHLTPSASTFITSGKTRLSNPYSMYFTLTDTNGDTLVFLRTSEITDGIMLVSESQIVSKLDSVDINEIQPKRLFITEIRLNKRTDGKASFYTYTDPYGNNILIKNKAKFLYYGYLIARIKHIAETEEFFFKV